MKNPNLLFLILSGVLFLFNLILTFIVSNLKKQSDLNCEAIRHYHIECEEMLTSVFDANNTNEIRLRNMRESYVKALVREIKRYKKTEKEKVRKLTYRTKR
jgi:hypothetical protein